MTMKKKVIQEYSSLASTYDRKYSGYLAKTINETLKYMGDLENSRVLDVGCGTGILLNSISKEYKNASLFGIDPTLEMLEVAKYRLPLTAKLTLGRAEKLPFPDNYFDVLVSTNSFHFIDHPELAIKEFFRVLKPEKRVVITDWCHDYLMCKLCDLFLRVIGRGHFKMLSSESCLEVIKSAEFKKSNVNKYKINSIWGMMTATGMKVGA